MSLKRSKSRTEKIRRRRKQAEPAFKATTKKARIHQKASPISIKITLARPKLQISAKVTGKILDQCSQKKKKKGNKYTFSQEINLFGAGQENCPAARNSIRIRLFPAFEFRSMLKIQTSRFPTKPPIKTSVCIENTFLAVLQRLLNVKRGI